MIASPVFLNAIVVFHLVRVNRYLYSGINMAV